MNNRTGMSCRQTGRAGLVLEAVRAGALLTGQGGGGEGGGVEYGLNTRTFYHIWLIIFHGLHVLVIPFFQIYFHNDQTFFSSHDGPDGVIISTFLLHLYQQFLRVNIFTIIACLLLSYTQLSYVICSLEWLERWSLSSQEMLKSWRSLNPFLGQSFHTP